MWRTLVVGLVASACVSACVHSETERAKPLRTPRTVDDVTGIWRTIHQNTLELRKNGDFVLITSVSQPLAGKYSLDQDRLTVFDTNTCGGATGTFRVQVAQEQRLLFSEADDRCALRRTQLTADPYIYAS